jgi:pectate lyase
LAVDNSPSLPPIISHTTLGYPIPNPTSGECSLSFDLAEAGGYRMVITNILGEEVKHLENRNFAAAGKYSVRFQTTDLEAGVYFITLSANGFRQARKLVVVK